MTPLELYELRLQTHKLDPDPIQRKIIEHFDNLFYTLTQQTMLSRMKRYIFNIPIKGIYLWGGVGRGKTVLMDLFYSTLPFEQKTRLHFHHFMQYVHHSLREYQGNLNPLKAIAKAFRRKNTILCFDELYVADIADAMILSELFSALYSEQLVIVATSNLAPDSLYENGLQRDKFLPTIDLIHQHSRVLHLGGSHDYRLQYLKDAQTYHYPLNEKTHNKLIFLFKQLEQEPEQENKILTIAGRSITALFCTSSVVWFQFSELCDSPRGVADYIEIARRFHTVFISGVEKMDENKENCAKRFVMMIDEFYERQVSLIIAATVAMNELYQGKLLRFEFQRTLSRLNEMQSVEYLAKPHLS